MPNCYVTPEDCKTELGKKMQAFRADRPSEWLMDEFIREADKLFTQTELDQRIEQACREQREMCWSELVELPQLISKTEIDKFREAILSATNTSGGSDD